MAENKPICKTSTKSGERCKIPPGPSGYCHVHDPEKMAERKKQQQESEKKSQKINEVIDIIKSTAQATGWICSIRSIDKVNWRYATVYFTRTVSHEEVTGYFDIVINNGVKISSNTTSFYSHGISTLYDSVKDELAKLPWIKSKKKTEPNTYKAKKGKADIEDLLVRFHTVARQLQRRHNDRETLLIKDEYDVQDLLHALLITVFDDVRPEESSPSYAGASSRIDFLLKNEEIVVEVKMTNRTLRDKKVGEQLIIDIKRYQMHPNCKTLICFIYDPEGYIKNPIALENDLSGKHDSIDVDVLIVPH